MRKLTFLAALLAPVLAFAQSDLPACFGIPKLHCGPSVSLMEVAPLGGLPTPVPVALGGGYQLDYHFANWDLGAALLGNTLYLYQKQPLGEVSFATFGCLGDSFGKLSGSCGGVGVPLAGPEGGVLGGWVWKKDVRLVFALGPDLLGFLAK